MIRWTDKDPRDDVIYSLDLGNGVAVGDAVEATEWEGPSDLVVMGLDPVGSVARVQISGGIAGRTYVVTCTAALESYQVLQRSAKLVVRNR